jgi:hypothetical protein
VDQAGTELKMASHSRQGRRRQLDRVAPSSLPRQQRRYIDRQLHKLIRREACSLCGGKFKHNTRTFGGLDRRGNITLAGECCGDQIAKIFTLGHFSDREYDFLLPRGKGETNNTEPTSEQIVDAIAAFQKVIADTDKRLGDIERRGGVARSPMVNILDYPWKSDDRTWFEQNPERSHRVRMPFPGELDEEVAKVPAEHALIVLLRQVEPGNRLKAGFYLHADLLPVPDSEAIAHALFEVATRREPVPPDGKALGALIEKYCAVTQRANA